jgi:hypothetical protein
MKIRVAFAVWDADKGKMPQVIAAVDEYTEDEWDGIPDWYQNEIESQRAAGAGWCDVREMFVVVPDLSVDALFEVPAVEGKVVPDAQA